MPRNGRITTSAESDSVFAEIMIGKHYPETDEHEVRPFLLYKQKSPFPKKRGIFLH